MAHIIRLWPTTSDYGPQHHQTVAHNIDCGPQQDQTGPHHQPTVKLWPTTELDCGPHNQPIIRLWPTTELDCGPHHQPIIRLWPTTELDWPTSSDCGPQQHQTMAHIISLSSDCGPQQHQTVAHNNIRLWPKSSECSSCCTGQRIPDVESCHPSQNRRTKG